MIEDPSEIPHSMHDRRTKVKHAHAAYDQIAAYVTTAMSAWMGTIPSNPMTAGIKDVQDRAIEIAKQNTASAFTLAGKIAKAKTPPGGFRTSDAVCSRPDAGFRQADAGFCRLIKNYPETNHKAAERFALLQGASREAVTQRLPPSAARLQGRRGGSVTHPLAREAFLEARFDVFLAFVLAADCIPSR